MDGCGIVTITTLNCQGLRSSLYGGLKFGNQAKKNSNCNRNWDERISAIMLADNAMQTVMAESTEQVVTRTPRPSIVIMWGGKQSALCDIRRARSVYLFVHPPCSSWDSTPHPHQLIARSATSGFTRPFPEPSSLLAGHHGSVRNSAKTDPLTDQCSWHHV